MLITELEAREKKLDGCDLFKRSQLAYKEEINRDNFVIYLNKEAYKILLSSVLIGEYPTLLAEQNLQNIETLKQLSNHIEIENLEVFGPPLRFQRIELINLENFYIATGFELFLKSRLIQNNYIVNIFEDNLDFKNLREQQKKRPILKSELFSISGYFYDESKKINMLKGITDSSLNFSTISTKNKYKSVFNLSSDIWEIIDNYRILRNQIHLPGDWINSPFLDQIGEQLVPKIVEFINTEIVENSNNLIKKWNLSHIPPFERLNYFD